MIKNLNATIRSRKLSNKFLREKFYDVRFGNDIEYNLTSTPKLKTVHQMIQSMKFKGNLWEEKKYFK